MRFKVLILALGVLATLSLKNAYAEVKSMNVEVKGLKCEFCVEKAENGLKDINWIKSAHVDLDASVAHIMVKKGVPIDIEELNQKVKGSGFTPEKVEITATGELTQYDGYAALRMKGSGQVFLLTDGDVADKDDVIQVIKSVKGISDKKLKELKEISLDGIKEITITGFAYPNKMLSPALTVEKMERRQK